MKDKGEIIDLLLTDTLTIAVVISRPNIFTFLLLALCITYNAMFIATIIKK